VSRDGQPQFGWYHENKVLFTFVVSPSTFTLQFFSTCCKASVPHGVHAVVPPPDKWRRLRNLSRVTSCLGVAGVSVAGNSSVSSISRHGGRGEVGDVEGTASAGAEESFGKQLEIRGFPAGVRPRFTLEDQGRSTTSTAVAANGDTTPYGSPGAFKIELLGVRPVGLLGIAKILPTTKSSKKIQF